MDLATATAQRDDALARLEAARKASAYSTTSRSKTNQALKELRDDLDHWQRVVNDLTRAAAGSTRAPGVTVAKWS